MSETFAADDEMDDAGAEDGADARDHRIIRLVELLHKLHSEPDAQKSLRNLYSFLKKECPNELVPVLRRICSWDKSPYSSFLYAKVTFENRQPKLAYKIISPVLEQPGASDAALLLGARICNRLGDKTAAEGFLARIPASSKLAKGAEAMKKSLEKPEYSIKSQQTKSAAE